MDLSRNRSLTIGWVEAAGKFRLIDDFSGSLVNATGSCKEQVRVDGVDRIVAVVKLWSSLLANNNVEVALTTGEVLRGTRQADYCAMVELFGKCYDLEFAYKQCPLADEENMISVVGLADPSHPGNTLFFLIRVLPFGASASVVRFNRVAAGLKKIMVDCLFLPAINFYDDFPLVVPKVLSAVVDMAVKALEKLTGWRWKGWKKDLEYESTFKALGVLFNLQGALAQGTLIVSNDAKRVEDICETVTSVARAGLLSPVSAARLAGRLGFAASQLFGRSGSACLWHLRQRAGGAAFSADLLTALHEWASTLRSAPPWGVKLRWPDPPVKLFTDGFCDCGSTVVAGFGAVIWDTFTGTFEFFGAEVPFNLLSILQKDVGGNQVVGQAELLAIVAAKKVWRSVLRGRRIVLVVDNDPARYGVMKGYSPSKASAWLLTELARLDMELGCAVWVDRVASASNPADGPSRLEFGCETGRWKISAS